MIEQYWDIIGFLSMLLGHSSLARLAFEKNNNLIGLGHLMQSLGQYMTAIQFYQNSGQMDNPVILLNIAKCWLILDDANKSLYFLNKMKQSIMDVSFWFILGIAYDRLGSTRNCIESLIKVIKLSSNDNTSALFDPILLEAYYRIGCNLRIEGFIDEALECFEFVKIIPPAPLKRVNIMDQIEITIRSKAIFEKIKGKNSESDKDDNSSSSEIIEYWYSNSSSLEKLLSVGKEVEQGNFLLNYLRGRFFVSIGKLEMAFEHYQRACKGLNTSFLWNSIGILYSEIRQYRDALSSFTRAISQTPFIGTIWINLGLLYMLSDQPSDALDALNRALELEKNKGTVKNLIEKIRKKDKMNIQMSELDPFIHEQRGAILTFICRH